MEMYHKATPYKENCLAHFEILRILKKIFPKIKESRTRTSEERKEVYLNLAISSCFASNNSVSDRLTCLNLKAYKPKFDFHRGLPRPENVEFISVNSEDRLNGNPVVRELRVTSD